jgi:signal transduction histidine kinase
MTAPQSQTDHPKATGPKSPPASRARGQEISTLLPRTGRRLGWWWVRSLSLTQRLLIGAIFVVGVGMLALGYWTTRYIEDGITQGVASTAAASIDSLISWQLETLNTERPLSPDDVDRLNAVFAIGNDASLTRLLQIRIHEPDGTVLYDSADGLIDREDTRAYLDEARSGTIVANIRDVGIAPVGPLEGHSISVLKVYTPIHRASTGEIYAAAELYFSAAALIDQLRKAQADVWLLVAGIGAVVVALLYMLVSRTSQVIRTQRSRLGENLAASRQLAQENRRLHEASEELRLSANSANEGLLAQVGSDIHDGPIQLLTLIILRLTKLRATDSTRAEDAQATIDIATEALEDLRDISSGLVLPELAEADLAQTIRLAISRHENLSGSVVQSQIADMPQTASDAVKVCAYRIVQESLNNAFRHGGAADQMVRANVADHTLTIEVSNPVGVPTATSEPDRSGLGIRGMRFRVESLGGDLRVEIGNSPLARIVATIPLDTPAV